MRCVVALTLLLFACTDQDPSLSLSDREQAEWNGGPDDPEGEEIEIEGGGTGWPDWWFPGPIDVPDPGDTGDGPYGGGPGPGSGTADPHPIPAPKDCTEHIFREPCMDCCDWNVDNVWGERCRRIPKNRKDERAQCWKDAEKRRADCYRACPPGITTTGPATPGPAIPGVP
jgi:hypothetical protein